MALASPKCQFSPVKPAFRSQGGVPASPKCRFSPVKPGLGSREGHLQALNSGLAQLILDLEALNVGLTQLNLDLEAEGGTEDSQAVGTGRAGSWGRQEGPGHSCRHCSPPWLSHPGPHSSELALNSPPPTVATLHLPQLRTKRVRKRRGEGKGPSSRILGEIFRRDGEKPAGSIRGRS